MLRTLTQNDYIVFHFENVTLYLPELLFTDFGVASFLGAKEQVAVLVLSSVLHSTCLQSAAGVYLCACVRVCMGVCVSE